MDGMVNMDAGSLDPGKVDTSLKFTAGTSGAVPSTLTRSNGIASVVKSTTTYVVTFMDTFRDLLGASHGFVIQASYAKAGACKVDILSYDLAARTVTLQPYDGDGDAVALASGDVLHFTFVFSREENNF